MEGSGNDRVVVARPFWKTDRPITGLRLDLPEGAPGVYRIGSSGVRFGVGTVAMSVLLAESLEVGQLAITPVKIRRQGRQGPEYRRALVSGELAEVNG